MSEGHDSRHLEGVDGVCYWSILKGCVDRGC